MAPASAPPSLAAPTDPVLSPGFASPLEGVRLLRQDGAPLLAEALRGKTISLVTNCKGVKNKALPAIDAEFIKKIGGEDMTEEKIMHLASIDITMTTAA